MQRRCVHDENGNVDPIKASENPVPRASATSKKRPGDENTPVQPKKKRVSSSLGDGISPGANFAEGHTNGTAPPPQHHVPNCDYRPSAQQTQMAPQTTDTHAPALDPNLFAYSDMAQNGGYADNNKYNYPAPQQRPQMYQYESLEQIASQVLDMNGNSNEDYHHSEQTADHIQVQQMTNGQSKHDGQIEVEKVDGSVDSGVSLPGSEGEQKDDVVVEQPDLNADQSTFKIENELHAQPNGVTEAHSTSGTTEKHVDFDSDPTTHTRNPSMPSLPLYRPPAPLSQSPELARRLPVSSNGVANDEVEINGKRKREDEAEIPGDVNVDAKEVKNESNEGETEDERKDRELAVALQQEGLGLRRR
jgi:F-box/leucine-rich repeat protein 10/11